MNGLTGRGADSVVRQETDSILASQYPKGPRTRQKFGRRSGIFLIRSFHRESVVVSLPLELHQLQLPLDLALRAAELPGDLLSRVPQQAQNDDRPQLFVEL